MSVLTRPPTWSTLAVADAPEASFGHSAALAFSGALDAMDLTAALDAYSTAPTWEDRWFCIEYPTVRGVEDDTLDSWCEAWPDHVLPFLLRGAVRAVGGASDAMDDLDRARELDPASPLPDGFALIAVARLGQPLDVAESRFDRHLSLGALYEPHVRFMGLLGPDHGGSIDAMREFGHAVGEIVEAGSALHAVVPLTAIHAVLREAPEDHRVFLRDTGLHDDVMAAVGRSVFHPRFEEEVAVPAVKASTASALALQLLGQDDLASMVADRLGPLFSGWPLSLLGPPTSSTWQTLTGMMRSNAPSAAAANGRA